MSYILDALKKSEKERMRKSAPDILSVQETILHGKKKKNLWNYMIIIALFANVFVFGYWLLYSENKTDSLKTIASKNTKASDAYDKQIEPIPDNFNIKQFANNNTDISVSNKKSSIIDKNISSQIIKSKYEMENISKIQPIKSEKTENNKSSDKESSTNHIKSNIQHSLPSNKEPVPETNKLYSINELPSSVKDSLPPINMTIFMYSDDPASRMVRINGQTLREGQNISEGVRLEEIRADGIIISYKNYKMHIGQKQ